MVVVVASYTAGTVVQPAGWETSVSATVLHVLLAGATAIVGWRAHRVPEHRAAWTLLACALAVWEAGNLARFPLDGPRAVPGVADAVWLAFYALVAVALVHLARERRRRWRSGLWLDGVTVGLLAAALLWTPVMAPALASADRPGFAAIALLVQLIVALATLAVVVGAAALADWRADRRLLALVPALAGFAASDLAFSAGQLAGDYRPGGLADLGWVAGTLLVVAASWQAGGRAKRRLPAALAPTALSVAALGVVALGVLGLIPRIPAVLALIALGAAVVRLALTLTDNQQQLRTSRHEAHTDPLTGLANRRQLLHDLTFRDADRLLVLFDLDGFKHYNDTFGHPAGDQLLRLVASDLEGALATGRAYRLGGDELCALLPLSSGDARVTAGRLAGALTQHGDGFTISVSCGWALLPEEASSSSQALRLADRRLYASKAHGAGLAGAPAHVASRSRELPEEPGREDSPPRRHLRSA
jgi:diguanylate cyclase (GGDEF)-like protein